MRFGGLMKLKLLVRAITHFLFRTRQFNNICIKEFAKKTHDKKILEIGSGKRVNMKYPYSAKRFFDSSNEFVCSDVVAKHGHRIVDVTKMDFSKKFDVVLCFSVLEHVFDFEKAIKNIYKSLKNGGTALIFVPGFYPLHDEPFDYWRFTEHSLRKILSDFKEVKIKRRGIRQYPIAYYVEAKK